jgi:hypothetical protein
VPVAKVRGRALLEWAARVDPPLSRMERRAVHVAIRFVWDDGACKPSFEHLAEVAGFSKVHLGRALRDLHDRGGISYVPSQGPYVPYLIELLETPGGPRLFAVSGSNENEEVALGSGQ